MKRCLYLIVAAILMLTSARVQAQRFSLSTNLLDYVCLGTANVEISYSVSRNWSFILGAEYNPFTYREGQENQFQLRQQSYCFGARLWPWHTWSGWWLSGKLRYQEYNFGGILAKETDEGDRAGLGLYAGYTYMIGPHFNIEFGLGGWGGLDWFRRYACQQCGSTLESGRRWFVLPDDITIALVYVF